MPVRPYPTFDGFSLQDDNYITSEVIYRNSPSRSLESQKIARRPGTKLVATDFSEKTITLTGSIVGTDSVNLQSLIDNLHSNVTRKEVGVMYVTADRSANATVRSVGISDAHYSMDYVPFEIEFLLNDPFFYGLQQMVTYTIASGTASMTDIITISGSVFAEPSITYIAPTAIGHTLTAGIEVVYNNTGETVSWAGSGSPATLAYSDSVQFDFNNHRIIEGVTETAIEGVFARWEPGIQTYQVTFSGLAQGGTLNFAYQPRYI
jgi:predicted phage tail component-like protein